MVRKPPRRLRRAAGGVLTIELGGRAAQLVLARAHVVYPSVAVRIPATRAGARDLLRTGAYAVALQRALLEQEVDAAKANALIADAVFASVIRARGALYRIAGLRYRRPLERARWGSRIARRFYYTPPDWVIRDVEVDDGFGFDVTRCVIAEFFRSLGKSDLCREVICEQDVRTAMHHGVALDRTQTLATGGSQCDFRYRTMEDRGRASTPSRRGRNWETVEDRVEVHASPEAIWQWLSTMADHYTEWHPDHVSARWVRGEPKHVGSRLEAIEYLGGHRERLLFEMTAVDPPWRMEYRIVGPHSILLPGGRFVISEWDHGAVFQAAVDIRFGRLVARLLPRRMEALRTHMHEEGLSLKHRVEAALDATR